MTRKGKKTMIAPQEGVAMSNSEPLFFNRKNTFEKKVEVIIEEESTNSIITPAEPIEI